MGLLNVLTLSLLVYVGLKWDIFRRLLLGLEVSAFRGVVSQPVATMIYCY